MLWSTNSVIDDFKNCVSANEQAQEVKNTNLYMYYYFGDNFTDIVDTDIKIKRKFVLHNFNKGVMWINYTYYVYDDKGTCIKGSHDIDSKWYIKKVDSRWIVYDIDEAP